MTLNFDPSADFAKVLDGTESVALRRRGAEPGSSETIVAHALRQRVDLREAQARNRNHSWKSVPSGGHYTSGDAVWHLPVDELPEAPMLGDLIVDADARRWTVLEVNRAALQTRWRCLARNLAIAYGLDDTVAILRAVYAKGTAGATAATWRTWKTGVRARIQPATVDIDTQHRTRQVASRYQIFLEEDVALDHTHLIRGPDGAIYQIRSTNGTQRIDELQTIDAIRRSTLP
ncbi:MAG TPA: hypothetical protein VE890_16715 [Thermoguttaceae bacterium]|nr:hypothetical protein [Thermoguttaceae bacterium]